MNIYTPGMAFKCKCGVNGEATTANDFNCICCNGNENYYIVCPNCNEKIAVDPANIPKHIFSYIRRTPISFASYHD